LKATFTSEEGESALLDRAAAFPKFPSFSELSAQRLHEITLRHGVDFATALLYDRIKRFPQHSDFISRIDRQQPLASGVNLQNTIVAVVPAAFYKENPNSGADGKLVLESAKRLGLRAESIPVSSTGTLAENADSILSWLEKHDQEKTILVSLCKGGADVKFALASPDAGEKFGSVSAWINICGTLNGSPVAEWLLASKPRFFIAWLYCKRQGYNPDFIRELQPSPQSLLSQPLRLPAPVRMINIVGFPLKRHLTNRFMRLCYQRISPRGPTDGGLLLADLCGLPGVIYPFWGADHYLRPESRARRIISAVLEHLLAADNLEESCLGHGTPAIDQTAQTTSA
jgi:hypothetical protein